MGSFSADIRAWVEKTKGDADAIVRFALQTMDGKLVERSPVGDTSKWLSLRPYTDLKTRKEMTMRKGPAGYVGGRFKGAWLVSVDSPNTDSPAWADTSGATGIAAANAVIGSTGAGHLHYIQNNLPYAKRLEDGWSRQAPAGLVGRTVVEFQDTIDAAVRALK